MGDFNLKKYQNHGLKVEFLTFFVSSNMLVSPPIFLVLQKVKLHVGIDFFPVLSLFSPRCLVPQIICPR